MAYINNIIFDRISEEANGDIFPSSTNDNETLAELGFDISWEDLFSNDFPVAGICDSTKLAGSIADSVESGELDAYLGPVNSQHLSSDHDNSRALMNIVPVQTIRKEKIRHSSTKPIALSRSVGVGLPQKSADCLRKISICYPLEEYFRARYKSDYFTQSGKTRRPRYVADRHNNHYVTLKVIPGASGAIRIDWLTIPNEFGELYSMPYRFQQSNISSDVDDCNPLYININADVSGIMKVFLVLIKSKQDELKSLQPLKPFRPVQEAFGVPEKKTTEQIILLNPKQLIQKYRLDKSQLAFTYCAVASDGKTCIPEWNTTVYSTILNEVAPESSKQKLIQCPRCTHSFQLPTNNGDDDYSVQETVTNRRPAKRYVDEQLTETIKKPKNTQMS